MASSLIRGLDLILLVLVAAIGLTLLVVLAALLASWFSPSMWTGFGRPLAALFNTPSESGTFVLAPWYLATIAVLLLLALTLFTRLRMMVSTVRRGTPFSPVNITHLRVIALLLGVAEVVTLARDIIVAMLKRTGGEVEINVGIWVSVLTLLVLAEVFREGARLQEQEEMTA